MVVCEKNNNNNKTQALIACSTSRFNRHSIMTIKDRETVIF